VRVGIHAMLDDAMLDAFGFRPAPRAVRSLVSGALRMRGRALLLFPARRRKHFITGQPQRSWPDGYQLTDLGPPPLLESRARGEFSESGNTDARLTRTDKSRL
jgi:hypothetical protein